MCKHDMGELKKYLHLITYFANTLCHSYLDKISDKKLHCIHLNLHFYFCLLFCLTFNAQDLKVWEIVIGFVKKKKKENIFKKKSVYLITDSTDDVYIIFNLCYAMINSTNGNT